MISLKDGMLSLGDWSNRNGLWAIFYADRDYWSPRPVVTLIFPRPIIFCSCDRGWFGQMYIRFLNWEFTIQASQKLFDFIFDQFYAA